MPEITTGMYDPSTGNYITQFTNPLPPVLPPVEDSTEKPDLAYVTRKAGELIDVEDQMEELEKQLEELKVRYRKLRLETLPTAMFELELTSIGVRNVEVIIEPLVNASLPKDPDKRAKALEHVIDLKLGGNIKRHLDVDLPKGDAIMEHKVIDALRAVSESLNPTIEATIHHSTYTAMCKKLVAEGKPVERDVLGIYVANIARVVRE